MSAAIYRRCGCRTAEGKQYSPLPDKPTPEQAQKACSLLLSDPKHGSWGFYVSAGFDPSTGKRQQVRRTGFTTRQAAQKARNLEAVKVDAGQWVTPTKLTLAAYLEAWLPRHARTAHGGTGLRPTSLGQYGRVCRELSVTRLGVMKLGDIRRTHVQALFDDLAESGRGAATLAKAKVVLMAAFSSAEDEGLLESNPANRVRLPREKVVELDTWSDADLATFIETANTYRLGAMFDLAADTGLRRGELIGLNWKDVDEAARTLFVRNNRTVAADGIHEGEPKTAASRRLISLSDRSIGILLAWRLRQDQDRAEWGAAWKGVGHVFTLENGSPLSPDAVTRAFSRLVKRSGVAPMRLHGLRHQHASLWVALGHSPAVLSQRLGHSSGGITGRYTHALTNADRDGAEAVSQRIASALAAHTLHTQRPDNEKTGQTRKVNS